MKEKIVSYALSILSAAIIGALIFVVAPTAKADDTVSGNSLSEEEIANQLQQAREAAAAAVQEQRDQELQEYIELGKAPENHTVNGYRSLADGLYYAKSTSVAFYGGQSVDAYVTTWDITPQKSPAAYTTLNILANILGADAGPMLQINVGNKTRNGIVYNSDDIYPCEIKVPADFYEDDANYAILHLKSDGTFELIDGAVRGTNSDPSTCRFDIQGGEGACMLIRDPQNFVIPRVTWQMQYDRIAARYGN